MVARHVISTLSVSQLESSHASIYESYLESHRSAAPTYAFPSLSELLPKPESSLDAQIESPSYCQSPSRSSNLPLRNWSLNNVTHRRNSLCIAQSAARETSIKHTISSSDVCISKSLRAIESSHASVLRLNLRAITKAYLESHRSAAPTYAFPSLSELLNRVMHRCSD